ncbi:MAG: AEC family transporter [Propionibacteriaceae bacterium]|nr:AEC family transporter [Propionibacteriaceae bacterium]
MTEVVTGFATIFVAVAVGHLVGGMRAFPENAQRTVAALAFYVGTPAKMFQIASQADLATVFSWHLLPFIGACTLVMALTLATSWRCRAEQRVMYCMAAAYTNSGNLGLPIAHYVLGAAAWVAPVFLLQVSLLQPAMLLAIDTARAKGAAKRLGPRVIAALVYTNPVTVGTLLGLAVGLSGIVLPPLVMDPITLLAEISIPLMLIAFGMGLRSSGIPRRFPGRAPALIASKCLLMPLAAWGIATLAGMSPEHIRAATVLAALPTAQVVLVHAIRYDLEQELTQQVLFATTLLSVPVIATASLLLM